MNRIKYKTIFIVVFLIIFFQDNSFIQGNYSLAQDLSSSVQDFKFNRLKDTNDILGFNFHVSFAPASSEIGQVEYNRVVQAVSVLNLFPDSYIVVRGHAERSEGSREFGQRLSEDRAKMVQLILVTNGLSSNRIVSVGDGFNKQSTFNSVAKRYKSNRRVDIFLVKDKKLAISFVGKSSKIVNKTVRNVQEVLSAYGYSPGPIDGFVGKRTREAIKQFQQDVNIPVTGCPDPNTLIALGLKEGNIQYNYSVLKQANAAVKENEIFPDKHRIESDNSIKFNTIIDAISIKLNESYTNNSWEDILKIEGVSWNWPYYESGAHGSTMVGISKVGKNNNPNIGVVDIRIKGTRTMVLDIELTVSNLPLTADVFTNGKISRVTTSCDEDFATNTVQFYKFEKNGYKPVYFSYWSSWGDSGSGGVTYLISNSLKNVLSAYSTDCKIIRSTLSVLNNKHKESGDIAMGISRAESAKILAEDTNDNRVKSSGRDKIIEEKSSETIIDKVKKIGLNSLSGKKHFITPPQQFMESKVLNPYGMNSFFVCEYTVAQFLKKIKAKELVNGKFPDIIGWTSDDNVYTLHAILNGKEMKFIFTHILNKEEGDGAFSTMYAKLEGKTMDATEVMYFVVY